jgi:hypothetical protein
VAQFGRRGGSMVVRQTVVQQSRVRIRRLVSCSPSLRATATNELSSSSGQEQSKDQEEPNDLIFGDT